MTAGTIIDVPDTHLFMASDTTAFGFFRVHRRLNGDLYVCIGLAIGMTLTTRCLWLFVMTHLTGDIGHFMQFMVKGDLPSLGGIPIQHQQRRF